MKKRVAILGSTGSIGTQALEVISSSPERFAPIILTAHSNGDLLIKQALEFQPEIVVVTQKQFAPEVKAILSPKGIKVLEGEEGVIEAIQTTNLDMVLTAMVGSAGLGPTVAAIEQGVDIALANKETLVVAGEIIMDMAKRKGVSIVPVDSEHSALFQCMVGEDNNPLEKIYLTASGGPFRGHTKSQLAKVSLDQALKHPNWAMGAKITIDSASMMNKGLEVIEAKWLFGLAPSKIDVIVHPQSIIHSIVQFEDGSMKAQMGLPDMKLPIQYAMAYPYRMGNSFPRFNFLDFPSLTFEKVDMSVFRNLALAFNAMERGGNAPCILNAANEVTNAAFRRGEINFLEIAKFNEIALDKVTFLSKPGLEELLESDKETRKFVLERIK